MAFETRADLWAAVSAMLNRADLDSFMPVAHALTESVLRRELRARTIGPVLLILNGAEVVLPVECAEVRSLSIPGTSAIGGGPLSLTTPSVIALHRARSQNIPGIPTLYAVVHGVTVNPSGGVSQKLLLAPAPNTAIEASILYYQGVPSLSDSSSSNWLLETAPDAYFYGLLVQFAEFLKEDDRIARWGQAFSGVIEQLNQQRAREEYGAAPQRAYNEYAF
jgi:hypothetical protein